MSLQNYTDLVASINAWTHRDDLSSIANDCIQMAESLMNQRLRLSQMEASNTTTTSSQSFSLPSDLVEIRSLRRDDYVLDYVTPEVFLRYQEESSGKGSPIFYTITKETMMVYPEPVTSHDYTLDYYKKITALSSTNQTNFILEQFPQAYLHGCMYFAGIYMQDAELAQTHKVLFDDELRKIQAQDAKRKRGKIMLRTELSNSNGSSWHLAS